MMTTNKIESMHVAIILVLLGIALGSCSQVQSPSDGTAIRHFVTVDGMQFKIGDEPYYFVGTNFWYGAYLGMEAEAGDRERLLQELDLLADMGVTNLRILAASEGASHKNALKPAFQESPGVLNEELMVGLDFLLDEMAKRDMRAVVFLNNFWEWSGGMNMYSEWYGDGPATNPSETGDWTAFMNHSAKFYRNEAAQQGFRDYISAVIGRTNSISGTAYRDDPTIMSWQLANEPRPGDRDEGHAHVQAWIDWIDKTSAFIKQLAPNQLVSSGAEGSRGSLDVMDYFVRAHQSEHVDYLTFHMWAKNWGWYKVDDAASTFDRTLDSARIYVEKHIEVARQLNKPITMEEFGLGRDGESNDPSVPSSYRDRYLAHVFKLVEASMDTQSPLAGTNFWAWGGFGKANGTDYQWRPGDPFTGDPPQEPQGLNSVFASDSTTLQVLRDHTTYISSKLVKN
jgi:mannan endo-1,4-beta-mannosidase